DRPFNVTLTLNDLPSGTPAGRRKAVEFTEYDGLLGSRGPAGYPAAIAGLGNGTSTTDIETRPISPSTSRRVPLPAPSPVEGVQPAPARTPIQSPIGCRNNCTVRFGLGSATTFCTGRAMPWVQSAGPRMDDRGPVPSMIWSCMRNQATPSPSRASIA